MFVLGEGKGKMNELPAHVLTLEAALTDSVVVGSDFPLAQGSSCPLSRKSEYVRATPVTTTNLDAT